MRKLNGLSIIENEYCYNEWRFDTSTKERKRILSSIREYRDPRDTTYYKESGTYQKAGVDYKVFKTDFERREKCEPYEGVRKRNSDVQWILRACACDCRRN